MTQERAYSILDGKFVKVLRCLVIQQLDLGIVDFFCVNSVLICRRLKREKQTLWKWALIYGLIGCLVGSNTCNWTRQIGQLSSK